jgi:phosphinothricin acetyltransferase
MIRAASADDAAAIAAIYNHYVLNDSQFRDRAAYDHVVETSIYLNPKMLGQGIGHTLYTALLEHAAERGYREAIGVLSVPNEASQALHLRMGFKHCGSLDQCGLKFGRYIDTAYYQRSLSP